MNSVIAALLEIQEWADKRSDASVKETAVRQLREKVPAPILAHFDRFMVRGKKGVAVVTNGVCTGCHMRLPVGNLNALIRDEDIRLCESCGRYLFVRPADQTPVVSAEPTKPARRSRKRKEVEHVV